MKRSGSICAVLVLLACAGGFSLGNSEREKKASDDKEVQTFTTADMNRKYGPSSTATMPAEKLPPAGRTPLERLAAQQQARRDAAAAALAHEGELREARAVVERLKLRQASLRNPLLPRPKLTAEETDAFRGIDQAERLRLTQEQLTAARAALHELEQPVNGRSKP